MESRFRVRCLGLLGASVAVIALASCGDDSPQEPTSTTASITTTSPTSTTTTSSTTTAPSSTTTAPSETTKATADFDVSVDADTEWGEVFDALTTTEQECIRDSFEGDLLGSVLARPVMSESDTPETWEVSMFSCLAPQTARAVFLALLVAGMEEDGVFRVDAEARACLDEWVAGIDVVATMVALSADDAEAAGEVTTAFMRCNPDLFISLMLEETGMTLEDLSDEEATCLRNRATGIDWATLLTGDDLALLGDFLPDLYACAPDMFISSMLEDTGLTLEDLSEEEATCLREWVAGTDWATLLTGDDFAVLLDFLPDLYACAPDMFISSVLEDTGLTLEDLSEEEAACLRNWVTDFDWASLFTGFADESLYLFELLECVPDLSWSEPGNLPWDQVIVEATPLGIGAAFQGELDDEDGSDYFTFEAEEGEFYLLDVTLGTLEDSVLDLYDADGNWLAGNDDYGDSTASRLIWQAPGSGPYHVEITSFGTGTGTYTLTITISDITDDHPNSTTNATPIELDVATQGDLEYQDDSDFFAFEATAGEYYELNVTLGTLQDSVLDIYDADGNWLTGQAGNDNIIWSAPSTGSYYVQVTGFDTGAYTLTITVSDITDDHPNSTTNATPIELDVATQGDLEYQDDSDFFAFEATAGEYYELDVTLGTLQDSLLAILDAHGNWLATNFDYSDLAATGFIWNAPDTGTYYVQVAGFGTGTGTGTGTYAVTISVSDIVDDHPNSADNATPVEIGVAVQGELEYEGDSDFFAFDATAGESYELDVTLGTLQDSVLDLYDADGTWLDGNDDYGNSTASRLLWTAPSTGTYYVRVTDFGSGTGTYTLTIATAL